MLYSALVDQNEPKSEQGTIWKVKKKFHPGNQSIVHFVDLIETNKKVYEADSPRSLLGPVEAKFLASGSKK